MPKLRAAPASSRARSASEPRALRFSVRFGRENLPLRAEVFSVDQLHRHGVAVAAWHTVGDEKKRHRDKLLPRLTENARILRESYEVAHAALKSGQGVVPAAEWLIDNFYVIETQIRTARQHLPQNYSRELPQLAGGPSDGLPRVYDIATELITHADAMLDAENLRRFVTAYQSTSPLLLGELWAIPIMLRLALIENLRRIAAQTAWQQLDRNLAVEWADRVIDVVEHEPKNLILVLSDLVRADPPMTSSFVAEYVQRLHGRSAQSGLAIQWLEQRLTEQGQTIDRLTQLNGQTQAAAQVSISNTIGSLRSLGAIDWRSFVEEQSRVERMLHSDPSEMYPQMTFATRDRYRHVVEKLARRSALTETQVARAAVELAQARAARGDRRDEPRARVNQEPPDDHVGFYLVDEGRPLLERAVGYRPRVRDRIARAVERFPLTTYHGGVAAIEALMLAGVAGVAAQVGVFQLAWPVWVVPFVLLALAGWQFSITVMNWFCTRLIPPRPINQLDFSREIPIDCRTLVVVPTMLTSLNGIKSLIDQMETRFLGNRDANLHFALLTDFGDADQETLPQDAELVEALSSAVDRLAEKYAGDGLDRFYLFHRPRRFNPVEGVWMGYERKRGKLEDLNALLCDGKQEAFSVIKGVLPSLSTVRYVITLDTDTQLPRDAAHQLIGCMAHPLNRPRFGGNGGCVTKGYAILQPRVAVTVTEWNRTHYSRLFAGDAGIDPYTSQVSDVYQDLFGNGSFIGKGIYDVRAFEAALRDRFPENRILSHDLIESCFARSGLASDIELFEGFPARYLADASRRHRWVRGDWQLLPWLGRRAPGAKEKYLNPLSALSRWKILDNLRRSLTAACLLMAFVAGWFIAPTFAWVWTAALVSLVYLPTLIAVTASVIQKPDEMPWGLHLKARLRDLGNQLLQVTFGLSVLPYEAHWHLDAVLRTVYRVAFSRKKLLEWTTASDAERRASGKLRDHYELMYASTLIPLALAAAMVAWARPALAAAAPLVVLWLVGPAFAWKLSQPRQRAEAALTEAQRKRLREYARRTWHYYETFVTERENWLAPDNFQEYPSPVIAPRTSPTNIGMGMMAPLAAWDFGYLTTSSMTERITRTLNTLDALDRYRGHFYNWYDTRTLMPLHPQYVSSVDSGNLAALLLTLQAGLEQSPAAPIVRPAWFDGLADTLRTALDVSCGTADGSPDDRSRTLPREIVLRIERLLAQCRVPPDGLRGAHRVLEHLGTSAHDVAIAAGGYCGGRVSTWISTFARQCREFHEELGQLAPWTVATIPGPATSSHAHSAAIEKARVLIERMNEPMPLAEIPKRATELLAAIEAFAPAVRRIEQNGHAEHPDAVAVEPAVEELSEWRALASRIEQGARGASQLIDAIESAASRCGAFAEMDFRFLYDARRELLSIGYNVSDRRMDQSYYDLLASESRLASFVAISQGQLPRDHWFALGRMVTTQDGEPTLLSWSGSMFEYLMPMLVMPNYEGTLIDLAARGAVARQIEYGRQNRVPWGVSESCYNVTDAQFTYQYRAFGVPGLGLQRGLGEDLVIAPYASVMALVVAPHASTVNLERMEAAGWLGEYGFYDAVDHTPARTGPDQSPVPCRTYMAHHSGMSLLALEAVLLDQPMQKRFLSNPLFKAHDLMLQERVPGAIRPVYPHPAEMRDAHHVDSEAGPEESAVRYFDTADTPSPEVHLLGNGRYHVVVSNSGSGLSSWDGLSVTRWQPDFTQDRGGQFCFLRDTATGEFWSTASQPTTRRPERYEAFFAHGKAEFRRVDDDIDLHTTIGVSPEDDVEVRRVVVKNLARTGRMLDLTSYAEVVLAPAAQDNAHRAFSNLFVTTELLPEKGAILCTRRPRTPHEKPPYLFHLMVCEQRRGAEPSFETDRLKFLGRGGSLREPAAMRGNGPLTNSSGAVLDPIVSIRRPVAMGPEETFRFDVITGVAATREEALALIDKYKDYRLCDRVFELAWSHDQVVRKQLGLSDADVHTFSRLAAPILYGKAAGNTPTAVASTRCNQSHLWAYGISGDLPIVLVRSTDSNKLGFVKRLLQAHGFWRLKGLSVDLVIWSDEAGGYRHVIHDALMATVSSSTEAAWIDRPGGIFVRRNDQLLEEDRRLLQSVACAVLSDEAGTLNKQLERRGRVEMTRAALKPTRTKRIDAERDVPLPWRELIFSNGYGGFTTDGKEYVVTLKPGVSTPAPWCNVLANERIGTVLSESGLGYTWFKNAHEYRLTPWNNDPVLDPCGEALYVRDEETGRFFSPTPGPARGQRPYICRHGFGYSVWEYEEAGLRSELTVFVAVDKPIKVLSLKVKNASSRKRSVSVTGYVEWVLGEQRGRPGAQIVTELDPQTGAIFARNPYSIDFGSTVAFFHSSELSRSVTCDRTEFIGRNGRLSDPEAMRAPRLAGRAGVGLDPCSALRSSFELGEGEEREIVFLLGAAEDAGAAAALVQRFQRPADARRALESVWGYWGHTLSAVHVESPDQSLNVLANGWLLYQTLACRFWARSGFYQSGGAFGFRDQLQDSLALIYSAGHLTREHLLRCAGRQFVEGDVQHWWHPPVGRGVRTHFSDDYLWLPYATARYVQTTGDSGVLQETAGFLTDRPLGPDEESYYGQSHASGETGSLYEHCRRAIRNGFRFGAHGLPLMGCGDWNDGMNLVGEKGRGESVWLGFFLHDVLMKFIPLARLQHDEEFVELCEQKAEELRRSIEQNAWDGEWYKRAWFDDGQPLGSAENSECRIDALPQSWSVIAGVGTTERMREAMKSVSEHLVRDDLGIIQLFTPPFSTGTLEPGYIKGYVPGVRENGGQYTHAAIWTTMAFAMLGETQRAWECFGLINPVNHAMSDADAVRYKVEPYVVAADVYSVPPHGGRGGWTWYTGSAGWMYRLIFEDLLGMRLEHGTQLAFRPCVPANWKRFRVDYRHRDTHYQVEVVVLGERTHQVRRVVLDGAPLAESVIPLQDDRRNHNVLIEVG